MMTFKSIPFGKAKALSVIFVLSGFAVEAATWPVSTASELADAISQAAAGDTIQLAAGTYDITACVDNNWYHLYPGGKSLTIEGVDGTSWREAANRETKTVITSTGTLSRHAFGFSAGAEITLRHLTFKGIGSNQTGGAIHRNGGGTLVATNCVFSGINAPNDAAIDSAGVVRDCLFYKNTATSSYGGAVGGGCEAYGCVFDSNAAISYGGAMGNGKAYDCVFKNNYSTAMGGATYVDSQDVVYSNCTFTVCKTTAQHGLGGAIYQSGGTLQVWDCTFDGCVANGGYTADGYRCGGAICENGGTAVVEGCLFTNCTAQTWGGAIYGKGGSLTARRCEFVNNTIPTYGGAVYNVDAYDCVFKGNTSSAMGGAMFVNATGVVVSNCTFSACRTTASQGLGGAIYQSGGSLSVWDTTFVGCKGEGGYTASGYRGGGAMCLTGGTCELTGCVVSNCTAAASGGGIWVKGGTLTAKDSSFAGNAAANGGGIHCSGVQATKVEGCAFSSNRATSTGGGINGCGNVVGCTFADNFAAYSSGHCAGCTVRKSRITGTGTMGQCKLYDCVFDGARSDDSDLWNRGLLMATHTLGGSLLTEAYNCLFVNCGCMHVGVAYGAKIKLVNCTMADCLPTSYVFFGNVMDSGTPDIEVVNSIFSGNRRSGNVVGLEAAFASGVSGSMTAKNCVAEDVDIPEAGGSVTVTTDKLTETRVRFCGEGHRSGAAPYTPRYGNSAVIDGGLTLDWTDADLDLAGNPRIRDSKVDVGCYETCYARLGSMLLVR